MLQETKLQHLTHKFSGDLWGWRSFQFIHKQAEGGAGGILVAWNRKTTDVIDLKIEELSVSILCKNRDDGFFWVLFGVYGPCDQGASVRLWDELSKVMEDWQHPWCSGGEYNAIHYPSERSM